MEGYALAVLHRRPPWGVQALIPAHLVFPTKRARVFGMSTAGAERLAPFYYREPWGLSSTDDCGADRQAPSDGGVTYDFRRRSG